MEFFKEGGLGSDTIKMGVKEFIISLLRHVPDKGFLSTDR